MKHAEQSGYGSYGSSLRDLVRLRSSARRRESSWDRSGGNDDRVTIEPGQTVELANISGAGSITHIWMTAALKEGELIDSVDRAYLRKLILRIYWDGADEPSVITPLADFFGAGNGVTTNFASAPIQMSPQDGRAFNCFFHMPFATGARFEIESLCTEEPVWFYFYIDYESFDYLSDDIGRFHALWNQEETISTQSQGTDSNSQFLFEGTNLDGKHNYRILEIEGRGHYVGTVLTVVNTRITDQWNWYGEGDDMFFIDGEPWPPRLHGTGTEDYFNTAWCPSEAYSSAYHGITQPGGQNWSGQISMYRFHIEDPIVFDKSLLFSIEHGHANRRADHLSSVAYWYQDGIARNLSIPKI